MANEETVPMGEVVAQSIAEWGKTLEDVREVIVQPGRFVILFTDSTWAEITYTLPR